MRFDFKPDFKKLALGVLFLGGLLIAFGGFKYASAKPAVSTLEQLSVIHPAFVFLDENGESVLDSGLPISTMNTCGACHDSGFIVEHSFHAQVGLNEFSAPGEMLGGHSWDSSPGTFGKWNPLGYRYLSPIGDEQIDITTPEWVMSFGLRHAGGGPAYFSRDGKLLTSLRPDQNNPETSVHDPKTGELVAWDWQESGVVEMNCFLCHTPEPNNDARMEALKSGNFKWANTATLVGTGLVTGENDEYAWNASAFDEAGQLKSDYVRIQDPTNQNCGFCHGLVQDNLKEPVVITSCSPERYSTITTGQIITGQRPKDSGLNLADKDSIDRSWDIHAERLVECTDCHFSLNNPVYFQENDITKPDHLDFDPRRLELGEYLYQPLHQFARGQSAQGTIFPELKDTMRRCESCHRLDDTHNWLPYKENHFEAVSCETCHIPKVYSSAARLYDWTVLNLDGTANAQCRGIEGDRMDIGTLVYGYEPVLLPRLDVNNDLKISPYNLITYFYWIYGNPPRPVPLQALQSVWLDDHTYQSDIFAAFDGNGDNELNSSELVIDTAEKESLIAGKLQMLGLKNPRIVGEVQPYSINHTVAHGDWSLRDCKTCHSEESRLNQAMQLASYSPMGITPEFVTATNVITTGDIDTTESGEIYFRPRLSDSGYYIFGLDYVDWIDLLGGFLFAGVLVGVLGHSTLRYIGSKRKTKPPGVIEKVYMYAAYERLWHWLQTFAIVILLFSGLIIHKPDVFRIFSFQGVVVVHNVIAGVLVVNAVLALFHNLVSGEIMQYIPRPRGFFDQAIRQTMYYLRGIFNHDPHPFEKTPQKKLNPLQQITYFGILNVLLPLQVVTGIMMWGTQRWPDVVSRLGGLPFLSPLHTLIAWAFASFIVGHVYLTTTGHEPLAGIRAMVTGWDELEIHDPSTEEKNK